MPKIHHQSLHEYFWRESDARHRLDISVKELSAWLGIDYGKTNEHLITMRSHGRLRKVGHRGGPTGIYEIADPDRWDPRDPSTHAAPRTSPQWE
jgi:hypothetical protein